MAQGPDPVSKSTHDLEQEITCGICHELYQEPKIFPCCHYYCKQCIASLVRRYPPNQPFPCPDCREPTLLPDNDPDKLPTAFFINRMKELYSRMEKANGRVEACCEMCSGGGKSVAFCRQCTQFICDDCVKIHGKLKIFTGHKIASLDELKQGGGQDLCSEEAPPSKCETHDEPKKLYCFDCKKLICRDCIIIDHAGHKYEFVKKAAPEIREKLIKQAAPLKQLAVEIQKAVAEVHSSKAAIEANGRSVTDQINICFQELQKILEDRRKQLIYETARLTQTKVENLCSQEKSIGLSLATVQSLSDFVERTLDNASDEEVVGMQEQVLARIEGELKKQKQGTVTLRPIEEADIGAKLLVAESLRDCCLNETKIIIGADPSKTTVEGTGIKYTGINMKTSLKVCTFYSNGSPSTKTSVIKAELESLVDNSLVQAKVIHQQTNKYLIRYTPKVRGRHQLSITVGGSHIPGSPFSVFVSIPPTKLGEPVRIIKGVKNANYIALNSADEMIVTCYEDGIYILNKSGTKLKNIDLKDTKAEGVAVDQEDNIYVCDTEQNCLLKFNKEKKLVKSFMGKIGSARISCLCGVAVQGDHVLVCDISNDRVIVLNKELVFINEFGSGRTGNGQFNDIITDNQGNVYVSDSLNNRVQVFTSDGVYVRSIGQERLNCPHGVCVDEKFVYIVDYTQHSVLVYKKNGEYVTAFGQDLFNPYGIAIDRDGFVYVCSFSSQQIFIF